MEIKIINFALAEVTGLAGVVNWLIGISSSIAVGVVLFTLILKLITFPFDLYSKISMRKNSLKMEAMRPELEKLQKQYAGDKMLYNQKMMALYKQNGYSMWGACLPTLITLVIFIVAISAFTSYSNYQNQRYFKDMSLSYNQVIYNGFNPSSDEYIKIDGTNFSINKQGLANKLPSVGEEIKIDDTNIYLKNLGNSFTFYTENGYTSCNVEYTKEGDQFNFGTQRFYSIESWTNADFEQAKAQNDQLTVKDYVLDLCRNASAETFRSEQARFLWIKNIFIPDTSFEHPIYEKFSDFSNKYNYKNDVSGQVFGTLDTDSYNELVYKLDTEKTEPNGYFILVVLTAGISLLLQLITTKSQKAQMELQTVDGQGAQTQKIMTWIMPIMMAFFAFMYTAAFSIYIVISSGISIITTLVTNFFLNRKYRNIQSVKEKEPVRGRVYVPKEQPKEDKNKQTKKNSKNKIDDHDFLSGLADKKRRKKI